MYQKWIVKKRFPILLPKKEKEKKKSPIQPDRKCLILTLVGFGSEAPQLSTKKGGVNV